MGIYFYPSLMLAGGLGVLLRHGLNRLVLQAHWTVLPLGTLLANVIGCFLIGYLATVFLHKWSLSAEMQAILLTGLLGGFTTFSAFSLEAVSLFERGDGVLAVSYICLSVTLCCLLCLAGVWLARH